MILIDSSIWIDYFNGRISLQTDWLDGALGKEVIIVGDIILTEVLQGFRSDKDYETAKNFLSALPFRQIGGYNVAVQSAQNYRRLEVFRGAGSSKGLLDVRSIRVKPRLDTLYTRKFGISIKAI